MGELEPNTRERMRKEKNKNILYITYDGLQDPLGQSQIVPYLKGLHQKGYSYSVISFEKEKPLTSFRKDIKTWCTDWRNLQFHKKRHVLSVIGSLLRCFFLGLYLTVKNKIQVIHCRSYPASVLGLCIAKFLRRKFIFDARGFWVDERVDMGSIKVKSLEERTWKFIEKCLFRFSDSIVVLTESMKKELSKNGTPTEKIMVTPTCVDLHLFKDPLIIKKNKVMEKGKITQKSKTSPPIHLVYMGSLGPHYLLEEMLNFFTTLKVKDKNVTLTIITHSPAPSFQFPDGVFFLKGTHKEIPALLNEADVGIAFLKQTFSAKGRCLTKIGEYLACGLPVIINKGIGDHDGLIKKERIGIIVEELLGEGYQKAADALCKLLDDPYLKQRCRLVAEKDFSLEKGVEKYDQLLKRL